MNGVMVYDLETAERVPFEEYSEEEIGEILKDIPISVLCIYSYDTERYYFFDEGDIKEGVAMLNHASLRVGFNSTEFDDLLLEAQSGVKLTSPTFDIKTLIYNALGERKQGYKLKQVGERTVGETKEDVGANSHKLYENGEFGKLYTYCAGDVALTKKLYDHIQEFGWIIAPDGEPLWVLEGK